MNPWHHLKTVGHILFDAGKRWVDDNAMRLSAAMAMYTVLAIAPLLVITIKVLGLIYGESVATGQVDQQVKDLVGPQGADAVHAMLDGAYKKPSSWLFTVISIGVLLFSASGVFNELRDSLNYVWKIKPGPEAGFIAGIRNRFQSVGMVFVIGLLLLFSQIVSTTIAIVGDRIIKEFSWLAYLIDVSLSIVIMTVLFTAIFRFLPDARIAWRDASLGALVTAVLFKLGQYLQALYFTYGASSSAAGLAGSFMVMLLWIYYSCWIFFYGAELTQVYAAWRGKPIVTDGNPAPV